MLDTVTAAPPDPILGLSEAFKKDTNPNKINLGVGIYQDERGQTPVLEAVKSAEALLLKDEKTKAYLPISGTPEYGAKVRGLLFGPDHEVVSSDRARTAHTPGGTGALRVGADFLKQFLPEAAIWVSTPTWANHKGIFSAAGMSIQEYPYYNPESKELNFEHMKETLANVPAGDIVLLHVCCHNPSGVDLSMEQWRGIADLARRGQWIPFLDFAYQGFGTGIEEDRQGVLSMAESVDHLFVASSFSKNVGLYRERTGALTLVAGNRENADALFSQIKKNIRVNFSNPPAHGGAIVQTIMGDETLRQKWLEELAGMRTRIAAVRSDFVRTLKEKGVAQDFSFIEKQKGMFSFSGLTDEQVAFLRKEKSIYIVKGGRINVAGITSKNIDYLCESIGEALN